MTALTEVIELINQAQVSSEKKEKTLEDVVLTLAKANNQILELVNEVRSSKRTENKREVLKKLYGISSALLDAISNVRFS